MDDERSCEDCTYHNTENRHNKCNGCTYGEDHWIKKDSAPAMTKEELNWMANSRIEHLEMMNQEQALRLETLDKHIERLYSLLGDTNWQIKTLKEKGV